MTEEQFNQVTTQVRTLEESLNLFIDFSMQTQRSQQLQINALTEGQRELTQSQRELTQAMQNLIEFQREVITRIDEMQSEVRGLQTENRRMLDLLLNRDQPPEENVE